MTLPGALDLGRSALSAVDRARTLVTVLCRLLCRADLEIDCCLDRSRKMGASPRVHGHARARVHHHVYPGFGRGLGVRGREAQGIPGLCSLSVGSACKKTVEGPCVGRVAAADRFPCSARL
jgi:hypothetical protein